MNRRASFVRVPWWRRVDRELVLAISAVATIAGLMIVAFFIARAVMLRGLS